jgi:hypothetical protein
VRKLEFENDAFGFADKVIEKCAFSLSCAYLFAPHRTVDVSCLRWDITCMSAARGPMRLLRCV